MDEVTQPSGRRQERRLDPAAVEAWVFDLDNTLYPASSRLFSQVDKHMAAFIQELLGISDEDARALQKRYYRDHGSTLRGLMVHHAVDPHRFLDYVHAIDVTVLEPSPSLRRALAALPGRRLIFTNASCRHATNVTDRLGVSEQFDGIFDIHAADYRPKPDNQTYERMVSAFGIDPQRSVFFEDIARNLAPAAALGMTTVWVATDNLVAREGAEAEHVHHVAHDLVAWLESIVFDGA